MLKKTVNRQSGIFASEMMRICEDSKDIQDVLNDTSYFDAASLVIYVIEKAGISVRQYGASYTGNLTGALIKAGFKDVTRRVNLATGEGLMSGDILITPHRDVSIYMSVGHLLGVGYDNGRRVATSKSYCNLPYKTVLRYEGIVTPQPTQKRVRRKIKQ